MLADLPSKQARFKNRCQIWSGTLDASGYPRVRRGSGRAPTAYAHRAQYQRAWGPLAPGARVYRTCGERTCVNPYHLTTTPPPRPRWRRPASARLTRPRVRAIREAWAQADRPTQAALAAKHRVSRSAISLVVRGITWTDV